MNERNLIRRLRLGEDSSLELMRVRVSGRRVREPDRDSVADQLAALANARGGTLALGVDDETHDYSMHGARIRLHLFGDRLELHVPGGLANGLSADSLHLVQSCRNELLVSLLARCPVPPGADVGRKRLMDRRGDGVPVIRRESHELSGRMPEYALVGDAELQLVIWAAQS